MSSWLARTVRRLLHLTPPTRTSSTTVASPPPVPPRPELTYDHAAGTVSLVHEFYGPLRLFADDSAISQHLLDGRCVWESYLVDKFAEYFVPGRNIIDAGANLGLHSIALAKLAKQGELVFAFEPHPEILPLTLANCARFPNIRCFPKAASDSAATFHMPSIRGALNQAGTHLHAAAEPGMFAVESVTIDSLELPNIGLIKVDVEGHEMECLQGAMHTIRRDRPVLFVEIEGGQDVDSAPPPVAQVIRARIQTICDLGYNVARLHVHDYLFTPR
ncbi:MAG: FkbM family methyltransferase [Pirellulales bacterium]